MSKVLYIKANAKTDGSSRTFKIANSFIENYKAQNPNDEIIVLDLYKEGVDFLTQEGLNIQRNKKDEDKSHSALKYAYQFLEADKVVFAEPMWNLNMPAILKAYIDLICVAGVTFKYTAEGAVGLCESKKVVNITTRGGAYSEGVATNFEMGDKYLRIILGFMGVKDITTIVAEGLDIVGNDVDGLVQKAINEAIELAKEF